MINAIVIRPMQPSDGAQIQSLDERVQPYRLEDQPADEAMFERAKAAEGNPELWAHVPAPEAPEGSGYLAFWVATTTENGQPERVVGMAGVGRMSFHILPRSGPFVAALRHTNWFGWNFLYRS